MSIAISFGVVNSSSRARGKRIRRTPAQAEREILEAAAELLIEVEFRDLTIDRLMARTGLQRSSFYVHFRDRNDVLLRLLARVGAELFDASARWFDGTDDPVADLEYALTGVVEVFASHGQILRAALEGAHHDDVIEHAYEGVVQTLVEAVAKRLRAEQRQGRLHLSDPDAAAEALTLMNERVLQRNLAKPGPNDSRAVIDTLMLVWQRTLYPHRVPPR